MKIIDIVKQTRKTIRKLNKRLDQELQDKESINNKMIPFVINDENRQYYNEEELEQRMKIEREEAVKRVSIYPKELEALNLSTNAIINEIKTNVIF